MEINNDIKAKLFAQYYGQKVRFWTLNGSEPLSKNTQLSKALVKYSSLLLKPLSSISDEDAIEVGKILQVYPENVLGWLIGEYEHEDFQSAFTFQHAIDYLRSKGYALPWMGLSVEQMVEAGWIKLTP